MAARAKNRKTFKQLLLFNQWLAFEIIKLAYSLDDPLPNFSAVPYFEQNGHQGYK